MENVKLPDTAERFFILLLLIEFRDCLQQTLKKPNNKKTNKALIYRKDLQTAVFMWRFGLNDGCSKWVLTLTGEKG